MSTITYTVTIASAKFLIDGAIAPKLTFRDGDTYVFDQADSTNSGHILQFSITSNNSGGAEYTTGVTKAGTPGSGGASTTLVTSGSTTDTIYYYSSGGGTYGEEFSNSGYTTTSGGLLKPIVGGDATAEKWGSILNHSISQIGDVVSGTHTNIPSVTTANRPGEGGGDNASITAVVGMLIYNTTLGILQQYAASGWASIDSPPTVASLNYPGDDTALDTVGEFNISCTTQTSTTVLVPGSTMPTVGQVVKGTGISAPVNNLTCGLTNTDATVTAASTTGLVVGMTVAEFTGVPARATILSIITDTSFELSAVATATNSSAVLSFNTTVESVSGTTSFVITPTATASATVTLTFNTQTLIISGTNFSAGATVAIDGTAPSTVTRNSSTQITVTGTPAKTAGTKVDGLVVTNASGVAASINVDYSALPAWTTSSGNVLSTFEGSGIDIDLAATGTAPITYALSGSLPGGLSMSTSTGDITGTISSATATFNFTVTATDAEAQSSPRLFNIINNGQATSADEILTTNSSASDGLYSLKVTGSSTPINVLCDFTTNTGSDPQDGGYMLAGRFTDTSATTTNWKSSSYSTEYGSSTSLMYSKIREEAPFRYLMIKWNGDGGNSPIYDFGATTNGLVNQGSRDISRVSSGSGSTGLLTISNWSALGTYSASTLYHDKSPSGDRAVMITNYNNNASNQDGAFGTGGTHGGDTLNAGSNSVVAISSIEFWIK